MEAVSERCYVVGFEVGEQGPQTKASEQLQMLQRAEMDSPLGPSEKECHLADTVIFNPVRTVLDL